MRTLRLGLLALFLAACGDDSGGGGGGGDGGGTPCPGTPSSGDPCTGSGSCEYGTESCCGNTFPSTVCQCQNGQYACYATDACLLPQCPDGGDNDGGGGGGDANMCPSTQPTSGVTSCSGSERCEYGTESCCGNTHPSLVCECQSGTFYCYYTDACLIPGCPDAGDYAGVGEVCQAGELFDAGTAPRPCEPGLVCCYPCGIAGCDFRCIEPCTPGPGCQESGCPGPFP